MIRPRPTMLFPFRQGIFRGNFRQSRPHLWLVIILVSVACGGWRAEASGSDSGSASVPGSWHLGLRSTGYLYQTADLAGSSENQFQGFQVFSGSVSGLGDGRFSFRGTGRLANDLKLNPGGFETSRLYNGYLATRLPHRMQARFGRQLVFAGANHLTLDGAWFSWRPATRYDVNLWAGARAPYGHSLEVGSFNKDSALGGRVAVKWNPRCRSALSLAINERDGHVAQQPLGLELDGSPHRHVSAFARIVYDTENEYWSRLQGQMRWRPSRGPTTVSVQFVDRRPFIDPASYFSRFADVKRIQVARGSLRFEKDSGFGGEAEAFGSFVDGRSSSRLGAALLVPGGRVGYSVRLGDTGEDNCFFGEYSHRLRPWLQAEGVATFQTYALFTDAPTAAERELTTFSARLRAQLRPGLRVMAEIQSLDNPLYSKDIRFLCGVDLAMSGGVSDYGLGQGGWLK